MPRGILLLLFFISATFVPPIFPSFLFTFVANILVMKHSCSQLVASIIKDFVSFRILDGPADMARTVIGTPYYMSPELFANRPYNYKVSVHC